MSAACRNRPSTARQVRAPAGSQRCHVAPSTGPVPTGGPDRLVYDALSVDPIPLDQLVRATGLDLAAVCGGLERLAQAGLAHDAGGWWERA